MNTTRRKFMKGLLPALGLVAMGIKEGLSGQDKSEPVIIDNVGSRKFNNGIEFESRSGFLSINTDTSSEVMTINNSSFPDGSEDDDRMDWISADYPYFNANMQNHVGGQL